MKTYEESQGKDYTDEIMGVINALLLIEYQRTLDDFTSDNYIELEKSFFNLIPETISEIKRNELLEEMTKLIVKHALYWFSLGVAQKTKELKVLQGLSTDWIHLIEPQNI